MLDQLTNWIGMAHRYCIQNPLIVAVFLTGWAHVFFGYLRFVGINKKIMRVKINRGDNFTTEKTFRWFVWVFYSCAGTRLASSITMFFGIYWLEAIVIVANAVIIEIAIRVYESQLGLFTAPYFSEDQLTEHLEEQKKGIKKYLLKNENFSHQAKVTIKEMLNE